MIFDSYDMSPVLFGTGKSARNTGSISPRRTEPRRGAVSNYKSVFNLRGDDGSRPVVWPWTPISAGRVPKYVATVPQIFDLWEDPQERYDLFMNNFTERTWLATISEEIKKLMKTFIHIRRANCRARATPAPSRSRITRSSSGYATNSRRKASTSLCPPATNHPVCAPGEFPAYALT